MSVQKIGKRLGHPVDRWHPLLEIAGVFLQNQSVPAPEYVVMLTFER